MCIKKTFARYSALADFNSGKDGDLKFLKGDIIDVYESNQDFNWCKAKNRRTRKIGLVPKNFLITVDQVLNDCECFFNITPKEATLKLMLPRSAEGTFLIRPRQNSDDMVLCLKYKEYDDRFDVATYIIYQDRNRKLYLYTNIIFDTIFQLVHYYATNEGLRCLLKEPYSECYAVPPLNQYEIPREHIKIKGKIGSGAFGDVHKALWNSKLEVAVKILNSTSTLSLEEFKREAHMVQKLQHPFILQLIGICSKNLPLLLVTEYMSFGNIKHFFQHERSNVLSHDHLVHMLFQIAQGMEYLVEMNVVHRDLRGDNILVANDYSVKISDFGLARIVTDDKYILKSKEIQFAMKWAAPEIIESQQITFDQKTDVWSYGITCFEIMSRGEEPYLGQSPELVIQIVKAGETMKLKSDFKCSDKVKSIIKNCWKFQPSERPTFNDIVSKLRKLHCDSEQLTNIVNN